MNLGRHIVFEGVDNSGKTTIATKVTQWLRDNGKTVELTHHPGATPVGQDIRQILKHADYSISVNAQALLFAADYTSFIDTLLVPSIQSGTWVVGDRSNFISSLAYQIASGLSLEMLDRIHDAVFCPVLIDLLFIFQCPWEEALRRKSIKNQLKQDRYEDQGEDYFNKLTECYNCLMEEHSERLLKYVASTKAGHMLVPQCYYIDASRSEELVYEEVISIIDNQIPKPVKAANNTKPMPVL